MTTTPDTSRNASTSTDPAADDASPDTVERVVVPAQVVPTQERRAPADAPRPVPSPRVPQDADGPAPAAGPAGLPDADVPGLYAPAPTGRTEPLAPAALVAGILLPPLGIVLGIVALYRIRRRASRGRALAVCGILVGALVSAVLVLVVTLSALVSLGSSGSGPSGAPAGGGGAVSQTCSGSICTVTARGAPVTVNGVGAGGADGISVLAIGEGSAAVASPEGPLEVPTGTALELQGGTQVVLTQASADTVVFVYQR